MEFIEQMEDKILENHRVYLLDITLKGTLMRWWATHHVNVETCLQVT